MVHDAVRLCVLNYTCNRAPENLTFREINPVYEIFNLVRVSHGDE